MTHHVLKSHPKYFEPILTGEKTFEVRKNDRDFRPGDTVTFKEYDPTRPWGQGISKAEQEVAQYTGRSLICQISYVFYGDESIGLTMPNGTCVFSIKPMR